MNATKHLGLVLFLTLAAGVATAAITHTDVRSVKAVAPQEPTSDIPRIVVTATRQQQAQADADDCENPIPRVVVIGKRDQVAAK